MSVDGFVCSDIWTAAALSYAGFETFRVEILGPRQAEFYFAAPSLDAQSIVDDYENDRLALTSAKQYSLAFLRLTKQVSEMRRRGETSWCSAAWQRGEVG